MRERKDFFRELLYLIFGDQLEKVSYATIEKLAKQYAAVHGGSK